MEGRRDDHDAIDELAMLADELLQQATEIRRQWQELGDALGIEIPEHARGPAQSQSPPSEPRIRPNPAEAPAPPPPASAAPGTGSADPVRLVALDMMLSGSTRDEVVEYLSATFGDHVDESVIDEVFSG